MHESSRTRYLVVPLILACFLQIPCVFARDDWIQLRSLNFRALSNAGESRSRRLLRNLEQFRYAFFSLFDVSEEESAPLTVIMFKNRSSFEPYNTREGQGEYYQRGRNRDMIAINAGVNDPFDLIFHEYIHRLTAYTPQSWPLWLSEGFAEFYSTFSILKQTVTIGKPISHHVHYLRQEGILPVPVLLDMDYHSPRYNEQDKRGVFYAESWAFVHLLMLGRQGEFRPQLVSYCRLLDAGQDPIQAFGEAFDLSVSELERELKTYIRRDSFYIHRYRLPEALEKQPIDVQPLDQAEMRLYLGDLLMETNRLDQAETHYLQAISLKPDMADPYQRLAMVARLQNQWEKAARYLEKAALRESEDYMTHFLYAENLMETALYRKSGGTRIDTETFDRVQKHLETAIRLMPGFARAYYMLGRLYALAGQNLEDGIVQVRKALQLEPYRDEFYLTLAELQMLSENYGDARETLLHLKRSGMQSGMDAYADYLLRRVDGSLKSQDEPGVESAPMVEESSTAEEDFSISDDLPDVPPRADGHTDDPDPLDPASHVEIPECRPSFVSIRNLEKLTGRLLRLDCGGDRAVYVVDVDGREKRFLHLDPEQPVIFSCELQLNELYCGEIDRGAVVYFHRIPGDSDFDGGAVAIELKQ